MRVSARTVSGGARPQGRLPSQHGFRRRITLEPLSRKGERLDWAPSTKVTLTAPRRDSILTAIRLNPNSLFAFPEAR
jgi:hypothetical protein